MMLGMQSILMVLKVIDHQKRGYINFNQFEMLVNMTLNKVKKGIERRRNWKKITIGES